MSSLAVVALALATSGCGDPDQYFRHADGGLLPVTTGAAGSTGAAGAAPTTGTGTGAAGTFVPGSGAAGRTGAAGTTGAAGGFATGVAGASGTAGTTGAAGKTGAAGTTGAAGAAATTGAAGAGTCPGCKIELVYTCLGTGTDSRNFVVEAKNAGSALVLFKELTLRYWYTADATKEQELDCDTADKLTCQYIVKSTDLPPKPQPKFVAVTPSRPKANEYVEIDITQGAMDVGGTTGRIQLRLHNKDFSQIDQTQDYSADCGAVGQAHDSPKVTAYIRGVLVSGAEP